MALHTKTVEFAADMRIADLAAGEVHRFSPVVVCIPETGQRKFVSVALIVTARGLTPFSTEPGESINSGEWDFQEWVVGLCFDRHDRVYVSGNAPRPASVVEDQTLVAVADMTDYFQNYFGTHGQDQTVVIEFSSPHTLCMDVTARLRITYEFDDVLAAARLKTVRIPIILLSPERNLQGHIPALAYWLPEHEPRIQDAFLEVEVEEHCEEAQGGVLSLHPSQHSVQCPLSGRSGLRRESLRSYMRSFLLWPLPSLLGIPGHFTADFVIEGNGIQAASAVLVLTYLYNHMASSHILNSVQFPLDALQWRVRPHFYVEEPAPLQWLFSAYVWYREEAGRARLWVEDARQQTRLYRGRWEVAAEFPRCEAAPFGMLYFNYVSSKHAAGADAHVHTIWYLRNRQPRLALEECGHNLLSFDSVRLSGNEKALWKGTPAVADMDFVVVTRRDFHFVAEGKLEHFEGDGEGIEVQLLHRGEQVGKVRTEKGGVYHMPWLDDTEPLEARVIKE